MLGPGCEEAALAALKIFPMGLQIGGKESSSRNVLPIMTRQVKLIDYSVVIFIYIIISNFFPSYPFLSCLILSYPILSFSIPSCSILFYPFLFYPILSDPSLSYNYLFSSLLGGITCDNAMLYLDAGASHVVVTSFVFKDGEVS